LSKNLAQSVLGIIIIPVSVEINLGFQGAAIKRSLEYDQYQGNQAVTQPGITPKTSQS
jgi:hypothetical protein